MDFDSARTVTDTAVRLLQCTNVLASVNSDDENQALIDKLGRTMKAAWLSKAGTKDPRGFVPSKSN